MRSWRLPAATACAIAVLLGALALTATGAPKAVVPVRVASAVTGPPASIASLGDSFNTGFAAGPAGHGDSPTLSWSTGTDPRVDSLYTRLLAIDPAIRGHAYLEARDGTKVGDLARQLSLAADHHAQLITVQSGGNDICDAKDPDSATPEAEFRSQVSAAIDVLRRRLPDARLLITSITDEGRWNDGSVQIPGNGKKLSDGTVCDPKLGSDGKQDPTRRAEIQAFEQADDAILAQVCATDIHCRYDGGAFYRLAYTPADISARDAFHPSITGLALFASTAWSAGFDYTDTVPPTVRATLGGSTVTLTGHAGRGNTLAGIEYRTAAGPYTRYTAPFTLAAGATATYRAVDRDGDISATWSLALPS